MIDTLFENRYLLLIAVIGAAAIYGIVTMQLMVAIVVATLAILAIVAWQYLRTRRTETEVEHGEGEAVLAAGLITLVALAGMQFIVWAIGLAFIFMVHQSLARIERRMDALEERGLPPR
jgi:prepilin signal peptidase PulO-like enzyme (type II secretory pathway)